jgi:hypothetical protein
MDVVKVPSAASPFFCRVPDDTLLKHSPFNVNHRFFWYPTQWSNFNGSPPIWDRSAWRPRCPEGIEAA